jgi:puromycin-sensitive aminopeptidase
LAQDQSYRLPTHARPSRYEITLQPDLNAADFSGHVDVDLEITGSPRRLVLNAVELEIDAVHLSAAGTGEDLVPQIRLDEAEQQLILDFDQELRGPARLSIDFRGVLNDKLRGFYRSTFRRQDGSEGTIATTQFEATDARRAFPCWDEPDFKAVFAVTLIVEEGLAAFSNSQLESSVTRDDGTVEMRFADTMVMSTYLVAFVVGPFYVSEPVVVDGIPVRVAALTGNFDLYRFALQVAEHSLRFLAGYFEIPYPAGKLDHLAIPDFAAGAMENLGAVTYRENLLLADPDAAPQIELQRIATVIAHETAHMWFGDLVTMKWWNGIWLNEAFATFMEVTTTDAYQPSWEMWKGFSTAKSGALGIDGLRATRPVEYPVGRPEEAEGMFDVLTYQKGGAVLKMLEQYLGADVFRRGISHYLTTHAYGNTETSDLWDALEAISGEPVRTIMSTWIDQGGYPVVRASLSEDARTVTLEQDRFLYDGTTGHDDRWAIPVTLRASVGGQVVSERLLVAEPSARHSFEAPVDWVVVNESAWGFYRVAYSPSMWSLLLGAGLASVLDGQERLAVLGDTWAAVTAGTVPLSQWSEAAVAVEAGDDPEAWTSLALSLKALERAGDDADRDALAAFARRLAEPVWDRLGWLPTPGESDLVAVTRARVLRVLADSGRDEALAADARDRLSAHLSNGGLPPDLIGACAAISVATGGAEAFETVLKAYLSAPLQQDKLRFLIALGDTPDPSLAGQALDLAVSPQVRSGDAWYLIGGVLANHSTQVSGWEWLTANWPRVAERLPQSLLVRCIEPVATFTDAGQAALVRSWVRARPEAELPVTPVRLAQILERMDVTVAMAGRLRGQIAAALG